MSIIFNQNIYIYIYIYSLGGGLTPLQRCSQCILQPQPYICVCVCVCVLSCNSVHHSVMVIVVRNGHDDTSSNPGRD